MVGDGAGAEAGQVQRGVGVFSELLLGYSWSLELGLHGRLLVQGQRGQGEGEGEGSQAVRVAAAPRHARRQEATRRQRPLDATALASASGLGASGGTAVRHGVDRAAEHAGEPRALQQLSARRARQRVDSATSGTVPPLAAPQLSLAWRLPGRALQAPSRATHAGGAAEPPG